MAKKVTTKEKEKKEDKPTPSVNKTLDEVTEPSKETTSRSKVNKTVGKVEKEKKEEVEKKTKVKKEEKVEKKQENKEKTEVAVETKHKTVSDKFVSVKDSMQIKLGEGLLKNYLKLLSRTRLQTDCSKRTTTLRLLRFLNFWDTMEDNEAEYMKVRIYSVLRSHNLKKIEVMSETHDLDFLSSTDQIELKRLVKKVFP